MRLRTRIRAVVERGDPPGEQRGASGQDQIPRQPACTGHEGGKVRRGAGRACIPGDAQPAPDRTGIGNCTRAHRPGNGPPGRTRGPSARPDHLERVSAAPLKSTRAFRAMSLRHPIFSRRNALQAGAIGLLGFGMNHLRALNAAMVPAEARPPRGQARACIYIFLSGGLAQHESFDLKPDAPVRDPRGIPAHRNGDARASRSASTCRFWRSGAGTGRSSVR